MLVMNVILFYQEQEFVDACYEKTESRLLLGSQTEDLGNSKRDLLLLKLRALSFFFFKFTATPEV